MNAAEHYAEAERLVDLADAIAPQGARCEHQMVALAAAQVHATLAVAASQMRSLPAVQAEKE